MHSCPPTNSTATGLTIAHDYSILKGLTVFGVILHEILRQNTEEIPCMAVVWLVELLEN